MIEGARHYSLLRLRSSRCYWRTPRRHARSWQDAISGATGAGEPIFRQRNASASKTHTDEDAHPTPTTPPPAELGPS